MEILFVIFWILPVVLWIWALVDILKSNFRGNNKVLWVLIVIFFPIVGALLYLFIGSQQKT